LLLLLFLVKVLNPVTLAINDKTRRIIIIITSYVVVIIIIIIIIIFSTCVRLVHSHYY